MGICREKCSADHGLHIVQSGGLLYQISGSSDSSLGKEGAIVRLMLQGNGLGISAHDNLVLTDDIAHTDSMNANFIRRASRMTVTTKQQLGKRDMKRV